MFPKKIHSPLFGRSKTSNHEMLLESYKNLFTPYLRESEFKREFVLNQKSRQNAKSAIEKGFFKLTNNANFG